MSTNREQLKNYGKSTQWKIQTGMRNTVAPLWLWFCSCKLTSWFKFICNIKVNLDGTLQSFPDMHVHREQQKIRVVRCTRSQLRSTKTTLCLLVAVLVLQTYVSFTQYSVSCFSHFFPFWWLFHCLKGPQAHCWRAIKRSSDSENMYVLLEKLCSDMSCRAWVQC